MNGWTLLAGALAGGLLLCASFFVYMVDPSKKYMPTESLVLGIDDDLDKKAALAEMPMIAAHAVRSDCNYSDTVEVGTRLHDDTELGGDVVCENTDDDRLL